MSKIRITETELEYFPHTPEIQQYWLDLYHPVNASNKRPYNRRAIKG